MSDYKIATVHVNGVRAMAMDRKDIPVGIRGAVVTLAYEGPFWDELEKHVVFQGAVTRSVPYAGDVVEFPPEVAAVPNVNVRVGVYGLGKGGEMSIPTLWADLGVVKQSAHGSFPPPQEQALPVWAQVLGRIGDLANLNTDARENLVAAINEVLSKVGTGGGNVDLSGYAKIEQLPDSTSDLTNDSGFITRLVADLANYYAKDETYTRAEIDARISAIPHFSVAVVSALPVQNISDTTIYLLTTGNATGDLYSEWIWANGKWELLGSQRVDITGYATEEWVRNGYQPKGNYLTQAPVESVNGKAGAVQLSAADVKARPDNWTPTAEEVGARPNTWMPTAAQVGALPSTYTPPNQTAEQVGADPKGTAANAVSGHNTATDSHGDIRLELKAINDRLTAFFDSDNQTLDELSEIVAYITSNKSLIDAITTSKVSVADIINNLTTNVSNKPLSAAQGVALKALIDAITIPTKLSQLTNDKGYLTQHQDISGKVDKDKLTLGRDASGLLYLYIDGQPAGAGIELPTGGIDGYITEDKQIIFNNLPDGEYTLAYIAEDGSIVPIGEMEKDTNVYYSITNKLTNCTNSNSATQAVQGGSYSATISANSGYELSSVKVTMGGKDVSSAAVSGGTITISNVTGNIVITAVATEIVVTPTYTNLFAPSKATINYRYDSSGALKAQDGYIAYELPNIADHVPFTANTKIYLKGATFQTDGKGRMFTYKANNSLYSMVVMADMTIKDEGNGVESISGLASSFVDGVVRVTMCPKVKDSAITTADIQNIVITIDEPIA